MLNKTLESLTLLLLELKKEQKNFYYHFPIGEMLKRQYAY